MSQSSQPPVPPRAPRTKSIPKKLQRGVDTHIPGVGQVVPDVPPQNPKKRGSSSKEATSSPALKKKKSSAPSQSKAKGKKQVEGKTKVRSKRTSSANLSFSTSSDEDTESTSLPDSEENQEGDRNPEEISLYVPNAVEEIKNHQSAPSGFKTIPVALPPGLNAKFREQFATRGFCAFHSVNLEQVKQECNLDLSPWFGPYKSFISIEAPYFPDLVKYFYFNMSFDHLLDSEGNVVEERISTSVRGVEFQITATILNKILKINNPPPATTPRYSNEDIYTTLVQVQDVPDAQRVHLTFKPAEMSPTYRAIWHIYARNFVQKGGSYTHFTQKDYRFFTAFIKQHPLNLGQWLFKEMSYFKFVSRKNSYMPFAPLISVILFYHKIWYVGPPAHMKYCPTFGPTVLKMMKIKFGPEGSGQSQAPQQSQAPSQSVGHEAHSAPPHPPLADYDQRIRAIVDEALTYQMALIRTEFDRVRADIKLGIMDVVVAQAQVQSHLTKIKEDLEEQGAQLHSSVSVALSAASDARDKVQQLLQHFGIAGSSSSSTFGFTSAPSSPFSIPEIPTSEPSLSIPVSDPQPSSPTFSFPSPPHTSTAHPSSSPPSSPPHATPISESQSSPTTPATIPFPDPPTSPSTVATEHFPTPSPYATHSDPIDPLTAMVIWTPPLVILDPDYVDDDDKGGEDKQ